jgi:hypothetical protein
MAISNNYLNDFFFKYGCYQYCLLELLGIAAQQEQSS